MRLSAAVTLCVGLAASAGAGPKAKNVILFVGDAGGLPTISAAAIEAGRPQQLFIQRMPWIGLMETSSTVAWVTDSAATMTAMVTGEKTVNGVVSQSGSAVRGRRTAACSRRSWSTRRARALDRVVSNNPITDATPTTCYTHVNDRSKTNEIITQVFSPHFGNSVDVMIDAGQTRILEATAAKGLDLDAEAAATGTSFGPASKPSRPTRGG
jgi:alkaline phosphatase